MKDIIKKIYCLLDSRYKEEMDRNTPEGRVIFHRLFGKGFLEGLRGKRIIEIGPKSGLDSEHLIGLEPSELVMVDLPSKGNRIHQWLPKIQDLGNACYVEANLQYMSRLKFEELGQFDLVWCTGVIYHNQEQLRLVRRLFDLCGDNGRIVLESEIPTKRKNRRQNVVEIHWPDKHLKTQNITHLPSALAMKSWLEMVGFQEVVEEDILSWKASRSRAVLTGLKTEQSVTMVVYQDSENPEWKLGDAL